MSCKVMTWCGHLFDCGDYMEMAIETNDVELYIEVLNAPSDLVIRTFGNPKETKVISIYLVSDEEPTTLFDTFYGYTVLAGYKIGKKPGQGVYVRLSKPAKE